MNKEKKINKAWKIRELKDGESKEIRDDKYTEWRPQYIGSTYGHRSHKRYNTMMEDELRSAIHDMRIHDYEKDERKKIRKIKRILQDLDDIRETQIELRKRRKALNVGYRMDKLDSEYKDLVLKLSSIKQDDMFRKLHGLNQVEW